MKNKIIIIFAMMLFLQSFAAVSQEDIQRFSAYYSNGMGYLKNNQYSSAISEFRKVLRFSPYDPMIQAALANAYLARAQYYRSTTKEIKRALVDYKSACFYSKYWSKDAPTDTLAQLANTCTKEINELEKRLAGQIPTRLQSAKNYKAQGELAAAGYDFQQLTTGSDAAVARENLANIYKNLNNLVLAIDNIKTAIDINPKNAKLHFLYGVMLDEAQNYDASMEEYNLALEYGDKSPELMEILENKWTQNIVNNPSDAQNYVNLGAIYQKQGNLEAAKAQYIKAIRMNPTDETASFNLASLYLEQKHYTEAINVYNNMLIRKPNALEVLAYKASAQYDAQKYEDALATAEKILRIAPDTVPAQNMVNDIVYNRFSPQRLQSYLVSKANAQPNSYEAQFNCALGFHKNKNYQNAITYYQRAMGANPAKEEVYINLAQIYIEQKKYDTAASVCQKGLLAMPDSKTLNQYLADTKNYKLNSIFDEATKLYEAKQYEAAINKYKQISNKTPEVTMAIANCYWEMNKYKQANEYYLEILAQNPNNKEALANSAYAYFSMNDFEKAKATAQKLLSIDKNSKEANEIIANITQTQNNAMLEDLIVDYDSGDYQECIDNANKLLAKDSNNMYALYYKGLSYDELKKTDDAIKQYKTLISKHPKFENAYYSLAVDLDNMEKYKDAVTNYKKFIDLKGNNTDDMVEFARNRIKELNDYLGKVNGK